MTLKRKALFCYAFVDDAHNKRLYCLSSHFDVERRRGKKKYSYFIVWGIFEPKQHLQEEGISGLAMKLST